MSQEKKIRSGANVWIERGFGLATTSYLDRKMLFMYVFPRHGDVVVKVRATDVVITWALQKRSGIR